MKKIARALVAFILGYQVRALQKKNTIKVIGVVGSIGKTSTKLAVAQTLSAAFKVRYQDGNYNDLITVPLIFFGENLPSLFNPVAWLSVFWRNQRQLNHPYQYDIVVVELGSDSPGQIAEFKKYLKLELAVVTAITPEHMAFFDDLDSVAKEELSVSAMTSLLLVNKDLCDKKYLSNLSNVLTYSLNGTADFNLKLFDISKNNSLAEQYSQLAAAAVAAKLGMNQQQIKEGLKSIRAVPGRMQILKGINNSTIIDDSYNASPEAVKLALKTLYEQKATQKIAVLGNMNELGNYSEAAHKEIGGLCDPKKLDLIVTIGPDANRYLAPAAEAKGCLVKTFDNPYKAGEYLKTVVAKGAAVLVKGSQNKVFAEEAIKLILANPADSKKLVRQTNAWLKQKQQAFKI